MRTRVPISSANNVDSDRDIREGYSTIRTRVLISVACIIIAACRSWSDEGDVEEQLLIPQVRPAHKYPNSPWEMMHPPGGDNAVCM
jgi:hypothetical protein